MPYVSVIIPAFNAADFVIDSYQSIVDQTIDDWEVIFVNDGSHDDTLSVLRSFATTDPRIKVVDLPLNAGPACARNAAISVAKGDWIATLDADDRYSPDRLKSMTAVAERAGADVVLDNQLIVDPISKRVCFFAFEPNKHEWTNLKFSDFLQNIQSNTFFDYGYLKPIIRRRWLAAKGIRYQEKLRLGEDVMLLLECYAEGANVILVSKPYYYYYFQYSQTSQARSPTSRTEAVHEPLLAAMDGFLEKHRSNLTRLDYHLVSSAGEAVRETMSVVALKAAIKQFNVVGLTSSLRHPIRLFRGVYFEKKRSVLFQRRLRRFQQSEGRLELGPKRLSTERDAGQYGPVRLGKD
jgi:succinoglycan biosynthesis protein ExoO